MGELRHENNQSLQIVTDRADATVGRVAVVAMLGAVLKTGEIVRQRKIAGEWSEAALVDLTDTRSVVSVCLPVVDLQDSADEADCSAGELGKYAVLPRVAVDSSVDDNTKAAATNRLHYVTGDAAVASYGKGKKIIAQVRYDAIRDALHSVCACAAEQGAGLHMPRIGSGLAGGEWSRIEDIILSAIALHDIDVYVYDYNG